MTNYRQSMSTTLEYMAMIRERKLIERELSDTELKRREEIAQDMNDDDFKDRYGDRWKEVKMAVATKQAKTEAIEQERDDLIEAGGFSPSMIKKLKKAYSTVDKVDPTSPAAKKMTALLDKMGEDQLKAIVKADIKFISLLAVNRLIRMGYKAKDIQKLKTEQVQMHEMLERWEIEEGKPGLWDNIHKKRERIKKGSGEKMRKPGSKGAPTDQDFKDSQEEVDLDEAPKYELYHKDFSSAMQHAYKMAKKLHGITIDPKEIDDKVATGPRKPGSGKTNKYRLKGDKGAIQVQVYNKGGSKPYELNFYKEEVELDEGKMKDLLIKGQDLEAYAKKHGGIDKKDMMKVAAMLKKGNKSGALKYAKALDTDPRDYILDLMGEEVELDESEFSAMAYGKKDQRFVVKPRDTRGMAGKQDKFKMYVVQLDNRGNEKKIIKDLGSHVSIASAQKFAKNRGIIEEVELNERPSPMMAKGNYYTVGGDRYDGGVVFTVYVKGKKDHSQILDGTQDYEFKGKKYKDVNKAMDAIAKAHRLKSSDFAKVNEQFDEGYLELELKDKRTAEQAYKYINNKIWSGGSAPYEDFNQEGNTLQIDTDGNLNRRNQMLKDLKKELPRDLQFKVAVNEAWEIGTDAYRKYLEDLTPMESARSDAMRAMRKDKSMIRGKDSADVDDVATDTDRKAANKNILQQLKKSLDTKGKAEIEFLDKKKKRVPYDIAVKVVKKYMGYRKSNEKGQFQAKIAKSYRDMLKALKEDYKPQTTILDRIDVKIQERKNG